MRPEKANRGREGLFGGAEDFQWGAPPRPAMHWPHSPTHTRMLTTSLSTHTYTNPTGGRGKQARPDSASSLLGYLAVFAGWEPMVMGMRRDLAVGGTVLLALTMVRAGGDDENGCTEEGGGSWGYRGV